MVRCRKGSNARSCFFPQNGIEAGVVLNTLEASMKKGVRFKEQGKHDAQHADKVHSEHLVWQCFPCPGAEHQLLYLCFCLLVGQPEHC